MNTPKLIRCITFNFLPNSHILAAATFLACITLIFSVSLNVAGNPKVFTILFTAFDQINQKMAVTLSDFSRWLTVFSKMLFEDVSPAFVPLCTVVTKAFAAVTPVVLITLSYIATILQASWTWATIVLNGLTLGTLSPALMFLQSVASKISMTLAGLLLNSTTVTFAAIGKPLIEIILHPTMFTIKTFWSLWDGFWLTSLDGVVAAMGSFSYTRHPQTFPGPVWSALSLPRILSNLTDSPTRYEIGGEDPAVLDTATLLQIKSSKYTLTLRLEIILALLAMMLLSWLFGQVGNTGKTRADLAVDRLAWLCAVRGDYDTTRFIRLCYLFAACSGIFNILRPNKSSEISWLTAMTICIFILTLVKRALKELDAFGTTSELLVQIQENRELHKQFIQITLQQESHINLLELELTGLGSTKLSLDDTIVNLRRQLSEREQGNRQLQGQIHAMRQSRQAEHAQAIAKVQGHNISLTNALHEERKTTSTLRFQFKQLHSDVENNRQQYTELLGAKVEAQFENELLKCTSSQDTSTQSSTLHNFAIPFVLVLVDGDAYQWATYHFTQTRCPSGANAAQAIKTEVQNYLIENKDRIPLQSRIVTRVFHNQDGTKHSNVQRLHKAKGQATDFLREFSQSMPLFDYIDSGTGKERADSKIQETAHLFIANSSCHAIFLAAATDNGFARLLEQYAYNPVARDKIVLVHPGFIIRETEALGLQSVQWPTVFQNGTMPTESRKKAARMAVTEMRNKREKEVAALRLIIEGVSGLGEFRDLSRVASWGPTRVGLRTK